MIRIRGEFTAWITLATTVGDGFTELVAGIGIVSADAFATGVAAVPNPAGDPDWGGWLWYHAGGPLVSLETTEVGRGPLSAIRIPIDTKAMRKMSPNEVLFGSLSTGTEIGTAAMDFLMNTRVLAKLH